MGSLTPLATALGIIIAVVGVGAFIAYFRDRRKYRGYEELMRDAESLAKLLRGEVFRDGSDLVVSGNHAQLPTYVRFSRAETTPGVHIRMEAPSNLKLAVASRNAAPTEGRVIIKTQDEIMDSRCIVRCNEPMQAKLFATSKTVIAELQKLCCSSRTYFYITDRAMELSELSIPESTPGKHISDHLASMQRLIPELRRLPGADRIEIKPIKRERRLILKTAMLIGSVTALLAVMAETKSPKVVPLAEIAASEALPDGVLPADAERMPAISKWRIAEAADFEGDGVGWLRSRGVEATGRVEGHFTGDPEVKDSAYVLTNPDGARRLVLLANGQNRYDVKYPFLGIAARVPKSVVNRIEWVGRPPETPDGDGLLIVRKPKDRNSGLIIFLSGGRIVSGVPTDYQSVPILE